MQCMQKLPRSLQRPYRDTQAKETGIHACCSVGSVGSSCGVSPPRGAHNYFFPTIYAFESAVANPRGRAPVVHVAEKLERVALFDVGEELLDVPPATTRDLRHSFHERRLYSFLNVVRGDPMVTSLTYHFPIVLNDPLYNKSFQFMRRNLCDCDNF